MYILSPFFIFWYSLGPHELGGKGICMVCHKPFNSEKWCSKSNICWYPV